MPDDRPVAPKFCKDCRYFAPDEDLERSHCHHDKAIDGASPYFVTGIIGPYTYYSCTSMRAGICSGGKLWEPK